MHDIPLDEVEQKRQHPEHAQHWKSEAIMVEYDPLSSDQRFTNLLSKAETHQCQFRPNETKRLEANGTLMSVLRQRTRECWPALEAARKSGLNLIEANEIAMPSILMPDEKEEDENDHET
jgi:hypothetical protein